MSHCSPRGCRNIRGSWPNFISSDRELNSAQSGVGETNSPNCNEVQKREKQRKIGQIWPKTRFSLILLCDGKPMVYNGLFIAVFAFSEPFMVRFARGLKIPTRHSNPKRVIREKNFWGGGKIFWGIIPFFQIF